MNRDLSVKKWFAGGKSRSKQSEIEDSWGFGVALSPQTTPGRSPKTFRIVWVVESLNHPILYETNTKNTPHMKFIFVETDDEY